MHTRFEVAVAGQHAGRDQIIFRDRFLDGLGQRTRIANAGRATVADEVEPERVEIFLQPGLCEIITHHS